MQLLLYRLQVLVTRRLVTLDFDIETQDKLAGAES